MSGVASLVVCFPPTDRAHLGSIPVKGIYFINVLSISSSPSVRYGTFYLKYTSFFLRTTFLKTRASDFFEIKNILSLISVKLRTKLHFSLK